MPSKTCNQTHRKTQLCRLRFHDKKYNLTKDNYILYILRAISTCVYCKSNIFEKNLMFRKKNQFTITTEVISLQLGCRSPWTRNYNLSYIEKQQRGWNSKGTKDLAQNRKKDEENEIWARSCKVYLSIWACSHNPVCKLLVQVQEQRPWTDLKSTGKTTMKGIFFS